MPRFSLIVATIGRTTELKRLLTTIDLQHIADIEVLVVDQNDDDRLLPILNEFLPRIQIRHLRQAIKGVSRARNAGLEAAIGQIVAFPDDDCWYPDGLLERVEEWFSQHQEEDILAVGAEDEDGVMSGNRWPQDQCRILPYNALRTTFASSLFLRDHAVQTGIRFDPQVSFGEETDYILKLSKAGSRGRFDRSMHICHPCRDMLSGTVTHKRATHYGAGMGLLVRRHALYGLWVVLLGYELLRIGAVMLRGDMEGAGFCWAHARGLFKGFASGQPV